ncbi:MAG: type II toxin-antitoxin system VapC family toxin [Nitrospirota bacterium]
MILYLGSSSLVKLYVEEPYTHLVRMWIREAEIVATCRITYTEVISALEMRLKQTDLSRKDYDLVVKRFSRDWSDYATVDFDDREAALFLKKYTLKRFDALHLSAAKLIQKRRNGFFFAFSSADERLCSAAESEGLNVLRFQ